MNLTFKKIIHDVDGREKLEVTCEEYGITTTQIYKPEAVEEQTKRWNKEKEQANAIIDSLPETKQTLGMINSAKQKYIEACKKLEFIDTLRQEFIKHNIEVK